MHLCQYMKEHTCVDDVTTLQCVLAPLHVVADHQEQRVGVLLTIVAHRFVEIVGSGDPGRAIHVVHVNVLVSQTHMNANKYGVSVIDRQLVNVLGNVIF